MTDHSVLIWLHEVLGVGTLTDKPRKGKRVDGTPYLKQYRWRCTFRDAYYVCCIDLALVTYKVTKDSTSHSTLCRTKLNVMNGKVVSLEEYKQAMTE